MRSRERHDEVHHRAERTRGHVVADDVEIHAFALHDDERRRVEAHSVEEFAGDRAGAGDGGAVVPTRTEDATRLAPTNGAVDVEDVIEVALVLDAFARVVDDALGSELADEIRVGARAHSDHAGAHGRGDLNGEGTHASGGAVDENRLTCAHVELVAQRLQRGERGQWQGRGLHHREAVGGERELAWGQGDDLGAGARAVRLDHAEHVATTGKTLRVVEEDTGEVEAGGRRRAALGEPT